MISTNILDSYRKEETNDMFRFNGGTGAITCDKCNVIFKEPCSKAFYLRYMRFRRFFGVKQDLCKKHKKEFK